MIQNKVSIRRAISAAAKKLELQQLDGVIDTFIEWAWDAEFFIGSSHTFTRKECLITMENGVGCMPLDVLYVLGVGSQSTQLEATQGDFQLFQQNVMAQSKFGLLSTTSYYGLLEEYYNSFNTDATKYSIHNGKIYCSNKLLETIHIAYQGVCTDEEGLPLINESHTNAIAQYLVYQYTEREYLRERAPAHVYDRMKQRWNELCASTRAEDEMPAPMDLRILSAIWNNMLPLPSLNNF